MIDITLSIHCFLLFILCCLSKAELATRYYIMDPSLDNKVSNNSLMTKHHSESLTECSAVCFDLCACFGFNPQLKECRVRQACDSSEMVINETGWRYFCPNDVMAVDCKELHEKGHYRSGVYKIHPTGEPCRAITVYCDMVTSGGGWTAIQRRSTPSVDFNRPWNDYKVGFGIPEDYWIGNEIIHQLTKGRNSSLYVSISLKNGTTLYELYEQFSLSDEADRYRLIVDGPATGTLGDSFRNWGEKHIPAGQPFSTHDQDNDSWGGNCAITYSGGWWFKACYSTLLNGPWGSSRGIQWLPVITDGTIVDRTLMMIKPR